MAVDVQLTKFSNCDRYGNNSGDVTFGYRIYDEYGRDYNNFYSKGELNDFSIESLWETIKSEHRDFYDSIILDGGFNFNGDWVEIVDGEVICKEA
ncbi:hypothetical protein [Niallia taxi]|uniref:hypothetical protein n=1 Tax=Niallia taxi TaxID=2499688 RepID=UPI0015F73447|nr:hypothetical protein [Niallia taxi]